MAARKRPGLSENTRLRIKTTMIVKRLEDHIDGKVDMSSSQVRAAEVLLNRTLPVLQSTTMEVSGGMEVKSVVSEEPITAEEWQSKYASPGHRNPDPKPH